MTESNAGSTNKFYDRFVFVSSSGKVRRVSPCPWVRYQRESVANLAQRAGGERRPQRHHPLPRYRHSLSVLQFRVVLQSRKPVAIRAGLPETCYSSTYPCPRLPPPGLPDQAPCGTRRSQNAREARMKDDDDVVGRERFHGKSDPPSPHLPRAASFRFLLPSTCC